MSLIRWSPLFMSDPFEDMDKMFGANAFSPAVDVYETDDSVVVEMSLAGFEPDKVDISIDNNLLTIKGKMEKKSEVEDKEYSRKEIRSGSFARSVALPARVEEDKAHAMSENGMLKISIPKLSAKKSQSVQIKVNKAKK